MLPKLGGIRKQITCERYEFVTNAYKYLASVANFERMSNIFTSKHIRKHFRLCVGAAFNFSGTNFAT